MTNESKTELEFSVDFGTGPNDPKLTYDNTTKQFSLSKPPLEIGTIEQLGGSVTQFFGADFPDTSNIPVLGSLLNQLSFSIKKLDYKEAQGSSDAAYKVEIGIAASGDAITLGLATVTNIDIQMSQNTNLLS